MNTASDLVTALEALELGAAFAEPVASAGKAIAAQRASAIDELFPVAISPTPSDAFAAFEFHTRRTINSTSLDQVVVGLHARSLRSWPALASLCRARDVLRDVGAAAARGLVAQGRRSMAEVQREVAEPRVASFMGAIAEQLIAADHELSGAARRLLEAEALAERMAAAKARQEEHAAAELARLEEERQAIERARQAELDQVAVEAQAEAERLKHAATAAAHKARGERAKMLARKIREAAKLGIDGICAGSPDHDPVWSISDLPVQLEVNGFSEESLGRIERALEATLARRKGRAA